MQKSFGDRVILDIKSLALYGGAKVGLVGKNGAGKSTLLAILAGEMESDGGERDARGVISVIKQDQDLSELREEIGRSGDDDLKKLRGRRALSPFPLSEKPSGGELTRAAIDAALAAKPDILLADEPTTNLDMDGVRRLQEELKAFVGALVMISHDRALLDEVCGEIWELESGRLRAFPGNYSAWLAQRDRERAFAAFEYEEYRREEKRLKDASRKLNDRANRCLRPPS
ncbi:MAG: ATP-binding cassette domain-containing protein, partial [Synergistaceae bacterium]|nr:ATP-binding cassette domain-containing protein [Synergistaceae bacterium]